MVPSRQPQYRENGVGWPQKKKIARARRGSLNLEPKIQRYLRHLLFPVSPELLFRGAPRPSTTRGFFADGSGILVENHGEVNANAARGGFFLPPCSGLRHSRAADPAGRSGRTETAATAVSPPLQHAVCLQYECGSRQKRLWQSFFRTRRLRVTKTGGEGALSHSKTVPKSLLC